MTAGVRSTAVALLAVALSWLAPAVASAEVPVARIVLYEVMESLELRQTRRDAVPFSKRIADAALLGTSVVPLSPGTPFAANQSITATATSRVILDPTREGFGTGPITGAFDLVVSRDLDNNGRQNLSDLVVVASGSLQGTLDLRPALVEQQPFARVSGQWALGDDSAGRFSGLFLIPFDYPGLGLVYLDPPELQAAGSVCLSGKSYVVPADPTGAVLIPVCVLDYREFVLGFSLTKAVLFLTD